MKWHFFRRSLLCLYLIWLSESGISTNMIHAQQLDLQHSGDWPHKRMPRVQTFETLFQPNYSHAYLHHASRVPFQHQARDFDFANAWWLAEMSMLAYADGNGFVERQLRSAGMQGVRFFRSPENSSHHTQAIMTFNANAVIVAFRGTEPNEWKDFKTDLEAQQVKLASGGKVHAGFHAGVDVIWSQMQQELERLASDNRTVWFTGHSLGAALAVLAAHRYENPAVVYTFGAPRVGNLEFSERYRQKTFRIVNNADLVTDLPPPIWYRHVGELIYLDSRHEAHRNMTMSSILQDKARGQGQAVTQRIKEWSNLKLDDRPVKPLLDHAPIAYVVHCWNLLIEQRRENRATLRP